jgi:vacuolar-type H+-ATPase subunit I/STV1
MKLTACLLIALALSSCGESEKEKERKRLQTNADRARDIAAQARKIVDESDRQKEGAKRHYDERIAAEKKYRDEEKLGQQITELKFSLRGMPPGGDLEFTKSQIQDLEKELANREAAIERLEDERRKSIEKISADALADMAKSKAEIEARYSAN